MVVVKKSSLFALIMREEEIIFEEYMYNNGPLSPSESFEEGFARGFNEAWKLCCDKWYEVISE